MVNIESRGGQRLSNKDVINRTVTGPVYMT